MSLTDTEIDTLLDRIARGFATRDRERAPILHTPAQAGLEYEDVFFPSMDGVPLEGWFVPADDSAKLVIANHPMGFSRSGQPTDRDPWHAEWGTVTGGLNGVEVDFIPDIAILHDAGYNVLTYDLRNHGLSGSGNGGAVGSGWWEARDVVGSLRFARTDPRTRDLAVGLFSRCLGCNSTFAAMTQFPDEFAAVTCLVGAQPINTGTVIGKQLALAGVAAERLESVIRDLDERISFTTSLTLRQRDTRDWAAAVTLPTMLYGVYDDVLTEREDLLTMIDSVANEDKCLHWIPNTPARWDGYLEFQRRPEPMLAWFDSHMT